VGIAYRPFTAQLLEKISKHLLFVRLLDALLVTTFRSQRIAN
jgi:hypothetical protein